MLKRILLLALCLAMMCGTSSCYFMSQYAQQKNNPPADPVTITIVYPDSEDTLSVTPGYKTSFTPQYINGKTLVGFYGQSNGAGTEYFNFKGDMNQAWKETNPTTLYAIYEDIDYSVVYHSSIAWDENPVAYAKGGGKGRTATWSPKDMEAEEEFFRTIYCNPNLEVTVWLEVEVKLTEDARDYYKGVTVVSFGKGADEFRSQEYTVSELSFDNYVHLMLSKRIKAKQLFSSNSEIYTRILWSSMGWGGVVKNAQYTVTIVDPTKGS